MKLTLYHYWRSSASWRVRMALDFKGMKTRLIPIDLTTDATDLPEFREKNPQGFVPLLEIEGSSLRISESSAMIEWLEETHPTPSLLPRDPLERAHARRMAQIINSGTHPIQNPPVSAFHSADPAEQKRWNQHFIREGLAAYEGWLADSKRSGAYSHGDAFSYPDCFLIPQVYNAIRWEVSLAKLPLIKGIYERALKLPFVESSHPDRYNSSKLAP